MSPKAELAEYVSDHLSRNANVSTMALASVIHGLSLIMSAYDDAQEKRGNWGGMLANLKTGIENIEPALPLLRSAGPGVAAVLELAEREMGFAADMQDLIHRLQAGESTLV
jgi:hypothetical protein